MVALPLVLLDLASLALASPSAIPVLPKSGEGWVDRLASMDLRWPVAPVAALQSPDELGVPPGQRCQFGLCRQDDRALLQALEIRWLMAECVGHLMC